MTREEAIEVYNGLLNQKIKEAFEFFAPELRESEDEGIRKDIINLINWLKANPSLCSQYYKDRYDRILAWLERQKTSEEAIRYVKENHSPDEVSDFQLAMNIAVAKAYDKGVHDTLEKQKEDEGYEAIPVESTLEYKLGFKAGKESEKQKESLRDFIDDFPYSCEQEEQKPVEIEVYEVGKGTTIYGQDYKCKKDYKEGNCWFIKDVIYHCSMDGYLTDQNGISWCCTPKWFKEYIQSNTEWAEEEKTRFVSGQFLQCKLSFDEFKEGEHYWLEYVGDDMYVGRSDNILNLKFHITPRQLYTLFTQHLEEKQKEQKPNPLYGSTEEYYREAYYDQPEKEQKPVEWSEEDEDMRYKATAILNKLCASKKEFVWQPETLIKIFYWLKSLPLNLKKKNEDVAKICSNEWSEEDERNIRNLESVLYYAKRLPDETRTELGNFIKSLCPQSKDETYKEKDEAFKLGKHQLAIKFMNYLDDNNISDGKMCLSNGECEDIDEAFKENDWAKIMRYYEKYRPHWKPSEEQLSKLSRIAEGVPDDDDAELLIEIYEQLVKLT